MATNETEVTFLALCTKQEPFITHQRSQEATWANLETDALWLLGDENIESEAQLDGRFLILQVKEQFDSILEKTIQSFRWSIENKKSNYFVRTNTSTYINLMKLNELLKNTSPMNHFAAGLKGFTNEIPDDFSENGTFLAGNMMIFSRRTTELLATMDSKKFASFSDDVAITLFLRSKGIDLTWIERNDLTDYRGFVPCLQHRVKSWTDYSVTAERMTEVHRIYSSKGLNKIKNITSLSIKEMIRYKKDFPIKNPINLLRNIKNSFRILKSLIITLQRSLKGF